MGLLGSLWTGLTSERPSDEELGLLAPPVVLWKGGKGLVVQLYKTC